MLQYLPPSFLKLRPHYETVSINIILITNVKRFHIAAVLKKPLRLPATPVPAAKNTHMCYGISLPDDVIVNKQLPIAVEPFLDNTVVMHHMNFWRCTEMPSKPSSILQH